MRIPQLKAIIAALESSKPTHDHYPEPVQRHQDALAAAKQLLAIAEHSVMPGIAEHALAGEIAAAVLADEQGEGCDLAGGLFGTHMTTLIRRIVDVYLARQPVEFTVESKAWEKHAASRKLNLCQHPLHYLYLDHVTHEARQAWKAALAFAAEPVGGENSNG